MDKFNRVDVKQPFAFEVTVYSDYQMSEVLLDPSMVEDLSYPAYNIENIKTDYYSFQHILPAFNPNIELSITYLENEDLIIHSVLENFFYPNNGIFYEVPTVYIVAKIYDIHSNSILNVNYYEGVLSDYSIGEYRYETPELYKITLKFMCRQKIRNIANGTGIAGGYGDGTLVDKGLKYGNAIETFFSEEVRKALASKKIVNQVKGKKYKIDNGDVEKLKALYDKLSNAGFKNLGSFDNWQKRFKDDVASGKLYDNVLNNMNAGIDNLIKLKTELEKKGYTLDLSLGYGSILGNHSDTSIHYEGRAFDVAYYKLDGNGNRVGDSIGVKSNAEENMKINNIVGGITNELFGFGTKNSQLDGGAMMSEAKNGNGWTHLSFRFNNNDRDEWGTSDAATQYFDMKENKYKNYDNRVGDWTSVGDDDTGII